MRGPLDTSVFVAAESGRPLDDRLIPEETALSVITLAELQAGVLAAADVAVRARRMATLDATADIEILGLEQRLLSFQTRYNATAKPFNWRYTKTDLNTYLNRLATHEALSPAA